MIPVAGHKINWTFNGSLDKPTFTPSVALGQPVTCHFIITDGRIFYCPDCKHELAGQTLDLRPIED
jgi:hypothetical protein